MIRVHGLRNYLRLTEPFFATTRPPRRPSCPCGTFLVRNSYSATRNCLTPSPGYFHSKSTPTIMVALKNDLWKSVLADDAADACEPYGVGLVEATLAVETGKLKMRQAFYWLLKRMLRDHVRRSLHRRRHAIMSLTFASCICLGIHHHGLQNIELGLDYVFAIASPCSHTGLIDSSGSFLCHDLPNSGCPLLA